MPSASAGRKRTAGEQELTMLTQFYVGALVSIVEDWLLGEIQGTPEELIRTAKAEYGADPAFTVQLIVVSGILHWNYEAQILIGR